MIPVINILLSKGCPGGSYSDVQHPEVLILAPTRELISQIYQEALKFSHNSVIKPVVTYGGTVVQHQLERLKRGCNILVATPGRLKDFVERGSVDFSNIEFFILDEADRMLGMGFGPVVREFAEHPSMPPTVITFCICILNVFINHFNFM